MIIAPGNGQCPTIELHRRRPCRGLLPIHGRVSARGAAVPAISVHGTRVVLGHLFTFLAVPVALVPHPHRRPVSQLCPITTGTETETAVRPVCTAAIQFTVHPVAIPASDIDPSSLVCVPISWDYSLWVTKTNYL